MPAPSVFTPMGLLAFSSRPSRARAIYDSFVAALGDNYDMAEGAYHGAKFLAWALELGRVDAEIARLGNQYDPAKITDLLPAVEPEYRLAPLTTDTVADRRAALAVRMRLPEGAALANVEAALSTALGADFVALILDSSPVTYPADPSTQGHWPETWSERGVYRLTEPAINIGVYEWVGYEIMAPTTRALIAGDVVVVTPNSPSLAERVTIVAANGSSIRFSHAIAHASGDYLVTGGLPNWSSSRRHCIVRVSAAAAIDPESRRKVHDIMSRVARVVSTWEISSATGPFLLSSSPLTATPFAAP